MKAKNLLKKAFLLLALLGGTTNVWGDVTELAFTATKTVKAGGEIWWTTSSNVGTANTAGWCSKNESGSDNKKGDITPSLSGDTKGASASVSLDGVLVKGGNTPSNLTTSKKAIVFKVTNTTAITAYGATTSGSDAAGLQWSVYRAGEGNTWTAVATNAKGKAASPNTTATISISGLSASATYIVSIEGGYKGTAGQDVGSSNQDVVVYAIKFAAPNAGAPTINTQPQSADYESGDVISALTVDATASSGDLSYQWYSCDDAEKTNPQEVGTNSSSYTPSVAGYYYCKVTDVNGNVDTDVVTITIADIFTPTISYSDPAVTINYAGSGTVYYTTDGTVPSSTNGTEYSAPFNLDNSCTVRAVAKKGENYSSLVKYDCYVDQSSADGFLISTGYQSGTNSGSVWTSNDGNFTLTSGSGDMNWSNHLFPNMHGHKMNNGTVYTLQPNAEIKITSIKIIGRTWLNGTAATVAVSDATPASQTWLAGETGNVSYILTKEFTVDANYGEAVTISPTGNQFGCFLEVYGVKRNGPADGEYNIAATWDFSTSAAQSASGTIGTSGSYPLKATNGKSIITYVGGSSDTYDSSNGYLKHGGASSATRYFILPITSNGTLGVTTKTNNGTFTIKKAANTTTTWKDATEFDPAVTITTTADGTEVTGEITYDESNPYIIIGFSNKLYTQKITWTPSVENVTLTTSYNMAGWRAFYDASNGYTLDGNTTAYVATAKNGNTVTMTPLVGGVPSGTAVILKTTSSADNYKMTLTKASVSAYGGTNLLSWTTSAVDSKYRLGYGDEGVGFYPYSGTPSSGAVILNISSNSSRALRLSFGSITGIDQVENGNIESSLPIKRIVNGKLVIEKNGMKFYANGQLIK